MKNLIALTALMLLSSACHTIVIRNGADASTAMNREQWHHISIIRLVEYSKPVDLYEICDGKGWNSVQTRSGPLQVLIKLIPYVSTFYTPEEVQISCKN